MGKKGKCYKFTFKYEEDGEVIKFLESIPKPFRGKFIAEVIKRVKADFINIVNSDTNGKHNNNLITEEEQKETLEGKDKEKELAETKEKEQSKENKQKPKLDFSKIFSL